MFRTAATVLLGAVSVSGHGAMNMPLTRASNGVDFDPADPAYCFKTDPGSCLWYNVGCMNGCDTCSLEGKILYIEPSDLNCKTPAEPTLPEEARSWNIGNKSPMGDWTKYNPWRSPGSAPMADPCGVASGYDGGGWDLPKGYNYGDMGSEIKYNESLMTEWKAGSSVEVSYAVWASHGGGIQYRLCPKDSETTEECFQANPLAFATNYSKIRHTDGVTEDIIAPAMDASTGVLPVGSTWRRMPVPACNCDIGAGCTLWPGKDTTIEAYDKDTKGPGWCPTGTQFESPGEGVYGVGGYRCTGGKTGTIPAPGSCEENFEWSIVDDVLVPDVKGDYVLGWRWDAEQTAQVWNTCADVRIV